MKNVVEKKQKQKQTAESQAQLIITTQTKLFTFCDLSKEFECQHCNLFVIVDNNKANT